jgi:hypothetical protein
MPTDLPTRRADAEGRGRTRRFRTISWNLTCSVRLSSRIVAAARGTANKPHVWGFVRCLRTSAHLRLSEIFYLSAIMCKDPHLANQVRFGQIVGTRLRSFRAVRLEERGDLYNPRRFASISWTITIPVLRAFEYWLGSRPIVPSGRHVTPNWDSLRAARPRAHRLSPFVRREKKGNPRKPGG